jgi:hypothetical protein
MRIAPFLIGLMTLTVLLACQPAAEPDPQVAQLQARVDSLQAALAYQPGFVHSVFFWLKDDTDRADFATELEKLAAIETSRGVHIGPPANTPRGVVDNSYHYALLIDFDDAAGHDIYQAHPIHQAFVNGNKDKWTKVVVYDTAVE